MDLQGIKQHWCVQHHCMAVLLVDVETEAYPRRDAQGNLLYYCLYGNHVCVREESTKLAIVEERTEIVSVG